MASGTSDSALFYPEGKGKWPAVLVWTDILGLRPVFRELGQRLAARGYVVLVPNLGALLESRIRDAHRSGMSRLHYYLLGQGNKLCTRS